MLYIIKDDHGTNVQCWTWAKALEWLAACSGRAAIFCGITMRKLAVRVQTREQPVFTPGAVLGRNAAAVARVTGCTPEFAFEVLLTKDGDVQAAVAELRKNWSLVLPNDGYPLCA